MKRHRVLLAAALLVALAILLAIVVPRVLLHPTPTLRQLIGYTPRFNQVGPPVRAVAATLPPPQIAPVDTAHVYWKYLEGPGDQGQVGQCQCYASRKQADYLIHWRKNQTDPSSWWVISCLFWYEIAGKGQDPGSYPTDYPQIWQQYGSLYHPASNYDYQGTPYAPGPYPPPQDVINAALPHRYQTVYAPITTAYGAGLAGVEKAELAIYRHNTVNFDFPVYTGNNSVFSAPYVLDLPDANAQLEGGHAVTFVSYYRSLTLNGTTGFFCAQNNWGDTNYGLVRGCLGSNGQPASADPSTHRNGYFLVSYRFVEQQSWGMEVLHLTNLTPAAPKLSVPPPWHQPGPAIDKPIAVHLFKLPQKPSGVASSAIGDWVYHVYPRDIGGDWGNAINQAAHANNISTPGLLSTLFSECGLFTHSRTCDRYGFWPDVSFGWCQVTVATAGGLGVGTGTYASTEYVKQYDNIASQCVWLAARYLGQIKRYLASVGCAVDFPNLYVAWNAGPGNPCSFIYYPSGQAGTNYYGNYLQNWRTALLYSTPYNPYAPAPKPKPKPPFPAQLWFSARGHQTPYYHRSLSWAASVWWSNNSGPFRRLGGVVGNERWFKDHRHGYMQTRFAHGAITCWPSYHTCKVVN